MARHISYFAILGLEAPPADRKAVKRAYSKQLKLTRPEDNPEGFMQLRDAHDLALNILARQAEDAKWEAEQTAQTTTPIAELSEPAEPDSGLTFEDMILEDPEPDSRTSYAIGPTPSLDAPVIFAEPDEPSEPPLYQDVVTILDSPESYNDRDSWNRLFREARQLDIDDYVDFEHFLMECILRFHGYYDPHTPHYDQPERLPQKLSPSISASLFKTMNWDKVGKLSYHAANQIEWLNRRMRISRQTVQIQSTATSNPSADSPNALGRWFWPILGGLMALAFLADLLN